MPSRTHLGTALVAVLLAFAPGCAAPGGRERIVRNESASLAPSGPDVDYSPSAIEARTAAHAHYAQAVLYEEQEEAELAAQEYLKAAEADLSNADLIVEAATRLVRLKKTDAVISLLTKATARADATAAMFARLGLAHSIAGNKEQAIEANRKAIKKDPSSITGYQFLAQLYLQNNQTDEGLKVLDEAARQPKADAAFLIELGESYVRFIRAGKAEAARPRALDALKRASALKPVNPALLQRLAEGYAESGETAEAAKIYTRLLETAPGLTGMRQRLVDILIRGQDRTNAIVHLRAILADTPTDAQSLYLLGSLLFEEKQVKEARDYFEKVVSLAPGFEPGYQDLAAALINLNDPQEALATLQLARKRFPRRFVWEFYSALAHTRMKDYTNALKFFTAAEIIARASETNRLTPSFYFQMGSAYERNHKFEEAEQYFRKSLALAPDFAEALNYLGYMWADRGENLAEAREMIEKAVKLEPKNAAFLDSLGWVLFKQDKPEDALKHILEAIQHAEEPDATLYDHLGDIYGALKKPDQAREAWRKAYSIEPSEPIQRKLNAAPSAKPANEPRQ